MIKTLIVLTVLVTSIFGQYNPKPYSYLGDKLFEANTQFESLQYNELLADKIQIYKVKSSLIHKQGLHLESKENASASEKKDYLKSLRKLETSYKNIIGSLQQVLLDSIKNNDYDTFVQLCNSDLNHIFESDTVDSQAIAYYQQNIDKGSINSVDQLIRNKKLEREFRLEQRQNIESIKKPISVKKKYTIDIQPYKDAYGNDYEMKIGISFDECKAYCLKDSKCKAFLFNLKREKCWFKEKVGHITDVRNGTLGIKKEI
jgi:hypothetical protein